MLQFLLLAGGVFWTLAYVLIVRRSYLDKCYGLPAVACAANLAWESYYTFVVPFQGSMLYVSACWLVLDLIIFSHTLGVRTCFAHLCALDLSYDEAIAD